MEIFNKNDLLEFAVVLETDGELFYSTMVKKTTNEDVKKIFKKLALEEINHKESYNEQLLDLDDDSENNLSNEKYSDFLHSFRNNYVYNDSSVSAECEKLSSAAEAVKFAMDREQDSILYFKQLKKFSNPNKVDTIDNIIIEETGHYDLLKELHNKLKTL
jgi:rubrerythrin